MKVKNQPAEYHARQAEKFNGLLDLATKLSREAAWLLAITYLKSNLAGVLKTAQAQ